MHYIRKLKEAKINLCQIFFVNLIYFLGTADKIVTIAFQRGETITHFYRQSQQYLKIRLCIISFCLTKSITVNKFSIFGSPKMVAAVTAVLDDLEQVL